MNEMNEDWHEIIQSLHVKTLFLNTCVATYVLWYVFWGLCL